MNKIDKLTNTSLTVNIGKIVLLGTGNIERTNDSDASGAQTRCVSSASLWHRFRVASTFPCIRVTSPPHVRSVSSALMIVSNFFD